MALIRERRIHRLSIARYRDDRGTGKYRPEWIGDLGNMTRQMCLNQFDAQQNCRDQCSCGNNAHPGSSHEPDCGPIPEGFFGNYLNSRLPVHIEEPVERNPFKRKRGRRKMKRRQAAKPDHCQKCAGRNFPVRTAMGFARWPQESKADSTSDRSRKCRCDWLAIDNEHLHRYEHHGNGQPSPRWAQRGRLQKISGSYPREHCGEEGQWLHKWRVQKKIGFVKQHRAGPGRGKAETRQASSASKTTGRPPSGPAAEAALCDCRCVVTRAATQQERPQ